MLVEQDFERFVSMSLRSLEAQAWTQRAANQGDAMAKNAHKSEHKGFLGHHVPLSQRNAK